MDITLDNFGRIVIPKKLRERLGLRPGSKLRLDVETSKGVEQLSIRPLREDSVLQKRGHLLVHTGELAGDVEDSIARDREQRIRNLASSASASKREG